MTLDEWVDLLKLAVGPAAFKQIGVAFLHEHFGRTVLYADGKGDGGVDAWIVLDPTGPTRIAAQFHAGKSEDWDVKLERDLKEFCAWRDGLDPEAPARQDFKRLCFVTAQVTDAAKVVRRQQALLDQFGVVVDVFDARHVASQALQYRGPLWRLLAAQLPGYDTTARPSYTPRDEALLAFSFFHDKPTKYRQAVAKSALATVLHRHDGACARDTLLDESARLLQLATSPRLLQRALRDLHSEGMIALDGDTVRAEAALRESTRASLALAQQEAQSLRQRCRDLLQPHVSRGKHHRAEVAARAVEAIFQDLGVLVRYPIAEQVLYAVEPTLAPASRFEREAFVRWKTAVRRIEAELGADAQGHQAIELLVKTIADDAYARRLAAAELFLQLTEHDAQEFAQGLAASSQTVLLDASVALPMLCALFDEPVASWKTSFAAHALHASLTARGARCVVPAVYLEEMAVHLLNARPYAEVIGTESDFERSRNYFVAHFCSLRSGDRLPTRTPGEFLAFLHDFGAPGLQRGLNRAEERQLAEHALRTTLSTYGIAVEPVDERPDDPPLPREPTRRDAVLLRHDRAVVRELQRWTRTDPRWLVCTADAWLRGVLNEREILAVDSVGLVDLLELVSPSATPRPLLGPLELAASLGDPERERAAAVWDTIVAIEGPRLRDRELVRRARAFRADWLGRRTDDDLSAAWTRFRDA
jgi:hypothetical protein